VSHFAFVQWAAEIPNYIYRKLNGMRLIVFLTALLASGNLHAQKEADLKNMEWLLGNWTRTNAQPGRSGVEVWQKLGPAEWKGRGISLRGADTTFVEKLKIVVEKGELFYVSDVPENPQPVYFKITQVTATGFVCENPAHDFPKKIEYWLQGENLKATISGDGKGVEYLFVRQR